MCQLLKFETIPLLDSPCIENHFETHVSTRVHERSDGLIVFWHMQSFVCCVENIIICGSRYVVLGRAIRTVRSGNNRGPPHRPNNVKRAIESRAHHCDPIAYYSAAARIQPGATAVTFVFRRHPSLGPSLAELSRVRGTQSEPFCSSNLKNAFFDVPRGESEVEPAGPGLSFGPRATHASGKTMIDAFLV